MSISWIDLGIIGAYLLAMLSIGYYVFRRAPSFEEYLIAGRSMTTPVLVCTLASTYYGLDVLFGTSEVAFNDGVVAYFGYAVLYLGLYAIAATRLHQPRRAGTRSPDHHAPVGRAWHPVTVRHNLGQELHQFRRDRHQIPGS